MNLNHNPSLTLITIILSLSLPSSRSLTYHRPDTLNPIIQTKFKELTQFYTHFLLLKSPIAFRQVYSLGLSLPIKLSFQNLSTPYKKNLTHPSVVTS